MNVPTYGDHAEAVAAAFQELLITDTVPAASDDVTVLLACREVVIDALRERLDLFGITPSHRPRQFDRRAGLAVLARGDQQLGSLLDRVVYEMPRLVPEAEAIRPSSLLGPRQSERSVELWRRAAVELLAGNHSLGTTEDATWARDAGAGWYVLRDLAGAVEAAVVLDQRLRQVGLLSLHDRVPDTGPIDEHRLIASQVARVATWYATSSSPDQSTPHLVDSTLLQVGPVSLVSTPSDLIGAQRRLASYLRPMRGNDSTYRGDPQIAAATARHLVASQLYLTDFFAEVAQGHPRASSLTPDFAIRKDLLQTIQPELRYLADVRSYELDRHRRWQQGEITSAVRRMVRDGKPFALTGAQVLDLANATHDVTHHLAVSLRRELRRPDSNLGLAHPIHKTRVLPVGQRSRLVNALGELARLEPPTIPVTEFSSPLQRAGLRATLDLIPTHPSIPCPCPAALKAAVRPPPAF